MLVKNHGVIFLNIANGFVYLCIQEQ